MIDALRKPVKQSSEVNHVQNHSWHYLWFDFWRH